MTQNFKKSASETVNVGQEISLPRVFVEI